MKIYTFIMSSLLVLIFSLTSYSQAVEVSFSIQWSKDIDKKILKMFYQYKIDSIPKLIVTLKNRTDKNLYLLKGITQKNYYPYCGVALLRGEMLSNQCLESEESVFDCIFRKDENMKWNFAGIRTLNDRNHKRNILFENRINNLMKFNFIDRTNNYLFFMQDLIISEILKNRNNDFIFLKKNSEWFESYNLIGFYILGGNYNFFLSENGFADRILAYSHKVLSKKRSSDVAKILFPEVLFNDIDYYYLFTGSCRTEAFKYSFTSPPIREVVRKKNK